MKNIEQTNLETYFENLKESDIKLLKNISILFENINVDFNLDGTYLSFEDGVALENILKKYIRING